MNDAQAVLSERRERLLLITINRPEQRNAVKAVVATTGDPIDAERGYQLGLGGESSPSTARQSGETASGTFRA